MKARLAAGPRINVLQAVWRPLGSLQLAVTLLPALAGVLLLGVLLESWYSDQIARRLVYSTWWFAALLAMLGINVLCAALKKWPWKRHQTGFLITHLGLITLVIGGLLDSLTGVRATIVLVDSASVRASQFGRHHTTWAVDRHAEFIQVLCKNDNGRGGQSPLTPHGAPYYPRAISWGLSQPQFQDASRDRTSSAGWLPPVLDWLADPVRRRWRLWLPGGVDLEVTAFAPHTQGEPYRPAENLAVAASRLEEVAESATLRSPAASFPAVKFQLASRVGGAIPPQWVAGHDDRRTTRMGPGLVEMLAEDCNSLQLEEFLHPPAQEQCGEKGQLVIAYQGAVERLNVADALGDVRTVFDGSWRVKITHYTPDYRQDKDSRPVDPALIVEMDRKTGPPAVFTTSARRAGSIFAVSSKTPLSPQAASLWKAIRQMRFWYHTPDPRYADTTIRAVLQFASSGDGRLYWRSFSSAGEKEFHLESSGDATPKKTLSDSPPSVASNVWRSIWQGMDWRFRVVEHFPRAIAEPRFTPLKRRLGLVDERTPPAIQCRLRRGAQLKRFWVAKTSEDQWTPVEFAGRRYLIGYHPLLFDLRFKVTLARAEQTTDPGSSRPASRTSYVLLTDPRRDLHESPRLITMNQPLAHDGLHLYQSDYEALGRDEKGKLISRSALQVSRDPGLACKYAGSVMVALGIGCMFYMKAYFFRTRGAV